MTKFQWVIFILIILLGGILGAKFMFYWTEKTEFYQLKQFISQCTTPMKTELANRQYRYWCDVGYFISPISPEKYQELRDGK